mmetsp:Transcript_198/g.639  ORF Transcript_198/g.639 Transcript_198/m.639 type:complete len:1234 (-) Transcript_198:147-3848(-)
MGQEQSTAALHVRAHEAAEKGNLDRLNRYLSARGDPDKRDAKGFTLLHTAASYGQASVCELLLQHNADPTLRIAGNTTALHVASAFGSPATCEVLLKYQADPTVRDSSLRSALHLAATAGDARSCELLIQAGANLQMKDMLGQTAFMKAKDDATRYAIATATPLLTPRGSQKMLDFPTSPGDKPDIGSNATWLNDTIRLMWPYISQIANTIARETVEPLLNAQAPKMLHPITFSKFSLGEQPLKLHSFTVADDGLENTIVLHFDVEYDGDADIELSLRAGKVGVKKLGIRGRMGVVLKPLVPVGTLIGAVQVFFVNCPDINLELSGMASYVEFPCIVRRVLRQVMQSFTLPRRFVLPMIKDPRIVRPLTLLAVATPCPVGVLRVTVAEAENLKASDFGILRSASSDPYVICTFGDDEFRTATLSRNLNPQWNETHDFFLCMADQLLTVQVWDNDRGNADDILGICQIEAGKLVNEGSIWLDLTEENGSPAQGRLRLEADLLIPLGGTALPPDWGSMEAMVLVHLDAGNSLFPSLKHGPSTDLDAYRKTRKACIYPIVSIEEDSTQKPQVGSVGMGRRNPKFAQSFLFHLKAPGDKYVKIQLMRNPNGKNRGGDKIGEVRVPLADTVASNGEVESYFPVSYAASQGAYVNARVCLYPLRKTEVMPPALSSTASMSAETPSALGLAKNSMEGMRWVNDIIMQLWPVIEKRLDGILRGVVEPRIQESLPSMCAFRFSKVSLGQVPMKFANMTIVPEGTTANRIELRCDVTYEGDQDITVALALIGEVGVADLQIKGRLGIVIGPLVGVSPLAGAVSLYFINAPELSLTLTGHGTADIPDGVARIVHNTIRQQVAQRLVLPNRMVVPMIVDEAMLAAADLAQACYPPPAGLLRLRVVRAMGLPKTDTFGAGDPYAIVKLAGQEWRTCAIDSSTDPLWDEEHDFLIGDVSQHLELEVFDHDAMGFDDFMGSTKVELADLFKTGLLWVPLTFGQGNVQLEASWYTTKGEAAVADKADKAEKAGTAGGVGSQCMRLVRVLLGAGDYGVQVDASKQTNEISSYVRISVGDEEQTGVPVPGKNEARFAQAYTFTVPPSLPASAEVKVEVFRTVNGTDESLGEVSIPLKQVAATGGTLKGKHTLKRVAGTLGRPGGSTLTMTLTVAPLLLESGVAPERRAAIRAAASMDELSEELSAVALDAAAKGLQLHTTQLVSEPGPLLCVSRLFHSLKEEPDVYPLFAM